MNIKSVISSASKYALVILLYIPTTFAAGYSILDLGNIIGYDNKYSVAYDVNENGQVVGDVEYYYNDTHTFVYANEKVQILIGDNSYYFAGRGINDIGHFTGWRSSPLMSPDPYLHDGASYTIIPRLPHDYLTCWGLDINNNDEIAGYGYAYDSYGNGVIHAYFYANGVTIDIGTLGGSDSYAYAVNNNSQLTGYSEIDRNSDITHAFLYSNNFMLDIDTLGGPHSQGRDINDNTQVTGYSDTSNGARHAFLYDSGEMSDLGTLGGQDSYGYGINNSGHIVGQSALANGQLVAFLYDGDSMLDLCELTNCSANGWSSLISAYSINDRGDIVGKGLTNNGDEHAFLALADVQPQPTEEICNDYIDNDLDGLIDCEDTQSCGANPSCGSTSGPEICNDDKDNDGDGLIDCADRDCRQTDPICKPSSGGGGGTGGGGGGTGGGGGKNR